MNGVLSRQAYIAEMVRQAGLALEGLSLKGPSYARPSDGRDETGTITARVDKDGPQARVTLLLPVAGCYALEGYDIVVMWDGTLLDSLPLHMERGTTPSMRTPWFTPVGKEICFSLEYLPVTTTHPSNLIGLEDAVRAFIAADRTLAALAVGAAVTPEYAATSKPEALSASFNKRLDAYTKLVSLVVSQSHPAHVLRADSSLVGVRALRVLPDQ